MAKNSEGEYWRPGMNWFKPQLSPCQYDGCQENFYRKAHTRRKYCDDCQRKIELEKWAKAKARMIAKGQLNGGS